MFGLSKGWKLLHESCPKCDKERKTRQQAAAVVPASLVLTPAANKAALPPVMVEKEFVAASSAATSRATEVQEAVPAQPAMMDVMLSTTRDGHFGEPSIHAALTTPASLSLSLSPPLSLSLSPSLPLSLSLPRLTSVRPPRLYPPPITLSPYL